MYVGLSVKQDALLVMVPFLQSLIEQEVLFYQAGSVNIRDLCFIRIRMGTLHCLWAMDLVWQDGTIRLS